MEGAVPSGAGDGAETIETAKRRCTGGLRGAGSIGEDRLASIRVTQAVCQVCGSTIADPRRRQFTRTCTVAFCCPAVASVTIAVTVYVPFAR